MSDVKTISSDQLGQAAKQRMEQWLLSPELRKYMQAAGDQRRLATTGPYIAISRQSCSDGTRIARLVGEQLGWDVLDKEVLDVMAERYGMPRGMLEFVDETKSNWVHDLLGSFIDSHLISHDKYVAHLQRVISLAALHGKVVFVGRGALAILPREHGLAVRIIAPVEVRVARQMERSSLDRREAAALVADMDKRRRDFCQRYFRYNIDDPLQYDLTINTARLTPDEAADTIVQTFRQLHERFE